jgi:NADH-quinone oxidoreductase subunit L
MLVNRIGDLMLLMGISLLFFNFNSLKYSVVFSLVLYYLNSTFVFFGISVNLITITSLFIFLGAMGKSAQLGLHM